MTHALEQISCPHCGKPKTWVADNRFKPFCSERCRMLDFDGWASDRYAIESENNSNMSNTEQHLHQDDDES